MNRRDAIVSSLGMGLVAAPWLSGCATPPSARAKPPAEDDVALLNRLSWGATASSAAALARSGRRDFIAAQLRPDPAPTLPPPVQSQIDAMTISRTPMSTLAMTMDQQRRDADALADDDAKKAARQAWQQEMTRLGREAMQRALLRAVYAPQQLQERLAWFWANHFSVHQYKRELRTMVGDYDAETLRPRALGKFHDLLIASATHPAMLQYLDNAQNAANRINENYAREVMELHTLGLEGGYSQKDVQELARVLTGLGVNLGDTAPTLRPALSAQYVRHGLTEFNPARHDRGEKTVLGFTVPAGGGWSEIIDQLMRLARDHATARHVCRKLAIYFVADNPPPALTERMTQAFLSSDGQIAATLQVMIDAPEFGRSLGGKFKDPMLYVVSAVRLAYDERPILNASPMLGWLNRLGEVPFNRQTPDGYPLDAAAWDSAGQLSTRFDIARTIGGGSAGLFRADAPGAVDAPAFPQLSNALYHAQIAPRLSDATQATLGNAASPQEWNALLLSSPEFMRC
jgi:uncharacterized protein (DUF1800 family)